MDGPTGVGREPQVSDHDLLFCDKLWAPLCAQCRSRMTIALCEPDFKNSSVATYRDEGPNYVFALAYSDLSTAADNIGSELIHIDRLLREGERKRTTNIDLFPFGTRTKIMDDMLALEGEGDCAEAIFVLT